MRGLIYVTHMLECVARAGEMDAGVSIWRNKIVVGEICYVMVARGR